jgi:hypothetical protein
MLTIIGIKFEEFGDILSMSTVLISNFLRKSETSEFIQQLFVSPMDTIYVIVVYNCVCDLVM